MFVDENLHSFDSWNEKKSNLNMNYIQLKIN